MFGARVVYDTGLVGRRNVRLDIGGTALHVYDQWPRSADRGLIHHLGIEFGLTKAAQTESGCG